MSRIGKQPVELPDKVELTLSGTSVKVKGPLGVLERSFKGVTFAREGNTITLSPKTHSRGDRALWGLGRTLLNNMVTGVSKGFEKTLVINGVGYRAEAKGRSILFNLGYSHPIDFALPKGIDGEVTKDGKVVVKGVDKELVGQVAANIRALRPPEPYKGKGVRYADEIIRRKAGKAG